MKDKVFLTRDDSQMIKGVAILWMLFHHLFAFPDRIPKELHYSQLVTTIASFGRVCVPMFLFISGYGLAKASHKSLRYFWKRIKGFYFRYWLVFILFIPLFFVRGNLTFQPLEFLLNVTAIKPTYNGEWWFIPLYLFVLLITPIVYKLDVRITLILTYLLTCFYFFATRFEQFSFLLVFISDLWPIAAYGMGILVAAYENDLLCSLDNIALWIQKTKLSYVVSLSFLLLVLFIGGDPAILTIFATPFLLVYLKYLPLQSFVKRILYSFGENSMFMWLTHSFYCYVLIPGIIYYPKEPILVFIMLLLISYLTALVLNKIYKLLSDLSLFN